MSTENTATTTTESTTTAPPATTPPPASAPPASDWTTGFSDELKGFVQTKNFGNPQTVVESYRNLEKLTGAGLDKLIKIPEKADAPEWNDVFQKLGRPAKPEEYRIPLAEGDKEGAFAKTAATWFHEAGLTQKQAEKVAAKWNEFQATQGKTSLEAMAAKNMQEEGALKTKWGAAFDQNLGVAKQAAAKFGATADVIDAMEAKIGYAKTIEFFHGIGAGLGEHNFVAPESGQAGFTGKPTPAQAQSRIQALRQDKGFLSRFASGDREAREEMDRLVRFANPDAV